MADGKDGSLVLVTGAGGFIALHIIRLLMKEGYKVRGTVRNLENESRLKPLKTLCPESRHQLQLFKADLTSDQGWQEAVRGCRYVIHVASPFPNAPPRSEAELVAPAVEGTKRVLAACVEAGTVKRVVLTSSISAIHGQIATTGECIYDEDDWSDVSSSTIDAYAKSKTLAEKAAWDFVRRLPPGTLQLAVVNPSLVMGPSIGGVVCTSLELIKRLMDGTMPLIPKMHVSMCDVRDVALAHLRAMVVPEADGHRHIVASGHLWLQDLAHIIRNEFAPLGYFIPTWPAPYFALWLYSFVDSSTRLILPRINKTYTYANGRMKEVLKVDPRSPQDTLVDTVYSMIECGVIKKTRSYTNKPEKSALN